MESFKYTIKDPHGIHIRAASAITKEAKKYSSLITLNAKEKNVIATRMMSLMGMGVQCGDQILVEIIGGDETLALDGMKNFFEKFL